MVYIKVLDRSGEVAGVQALEDPFYVRFERGVLTRCSEADAKGLLLPDANTVVNYRGGLGADLSAVVIPIAEYDTLQVDAPDPEDAEPAPAEDPELEILSRAELTAKVKAQEKEIQEQKTEIQDLNEQIELLLSGVTA